MSAYRQWLKQIAKLGLILMMGVSMNTNAGFLGFGGDSWKEEVLLHDGQKIIVKRSQSYGGRHEVGQGSPIKEHTLTFSLPNTSKILTFKSEFSEDVGRANFNLLALHILNGTPYVVAEPNLCNSYNKWGRPNPPYVIFKHDGKAWQRIQINELPVEFKNINVVINTQDRDWELAKRAVISAEKVSRINGSLKQYPQYQTILREAYSGAAAGCEEEEIRTGDGWRSIGWFSSRKTYEECLKICKREKVSAENCPCNKLFKGEK